MLSNEINAIPTVGGPSLPLLSYLGAFNFIQNSSKVIDEGYKKVCPVFQYYNISSVGLQYYGRAFKVAMLDQWFVVVSGVDMVEDVRKRHEQQLSAREGIGEVSLDSKLIFIFINSGS